MGWNIFKWFRSSKKETSSENDNKGFKLNEFKGKENNYTPFSGNTVDKLAFNETQAKATLLKYMKNPNGVDNKNQFVTHVVKVLNDVVKSRNTGKEQTKKTGISKMLEALKNQSIEKQIEILRTGKVKGKNIIGWFSFWDSSMQKAFSNGVENLQDTTSEEQTKTNLENIALIEKEEENKSINISKANEDDIQRTDDKKSIELKIKGNEDENKDPNDDNKKENKKTNENTESNIKKLEEEKLKLKNETIIEKKENNEISGTEDKIILIENENSNANNKNEDIKIEEEQTNNEENIKEEIPEQKDNENQEVKIEIIETVPESKSATTVLEEFKNNLDESLKDKKNTVAEVTKIICEAMVKMPEKEQIELVTIDRKNKSDMYDWFQKRYPEANKKTFGQGARYKKQHLIQSLTNALFSGNIKEKLEYLRIYKNGELLGNEDLKSLKKEEKIEIIEQYDDDEKKQIAEQKSEKNNAIGPKEEMIEHKDNENKEVNIEIIKNNNYKEIKNEKINNEKGIVLRNKNNEIIRKDYKMVTYTLEKFKISLENSLKSKENITNDEFTKIICKTMKDISEEDQKALTKIDDENKTKIHKMFKSFYSINSANNDGGLGGLVKSLVHSITSGRIEDMLKLNKLYNNGELLPRGKLEEGLGEQTFNRRNLNDTKVPEIDIEHKKMEYLPKSENIMSSNEHIKEIKPFVNKNDIKKNLSGSKINKNKSNYNGAKKKDDNEKYSSMMSSENWINNIKPSVENNAKKAASYRVRNQGPFDYWYADQLLYGLCTSLINEQDTGDKSRLVHFVQYAKLEQLMDAIVTLFKQIFDLSSGFDESYAKYKSNEYNKQHGYEDKLINYANNTIVNIHTIAKAFQTAAESGDFKESLKQNKILNQNGTDVGDKYESTSYGKRKK